MTGELPAKIDRYEIKSLIGQGGMASVYRAYDPRFERDVALKLMPKAFLYEPDFRTRFIREAKTIAMLEHPNIVPVYDFGDDAGQPYLVMRLMNGGSLSDKLENGPLPMNEVLKIMERVGAALDAAHERGVVHRDLKPANILFDQYGNAYLADFGIVRLADGGGTSLTGTGTIGTPGYMSPEQIQGHQLDGRADIYALGVMLFEMITGERPYKADSAPMMIVKQMTEEVPKLRSINPSLPGSYEAVIERVTAKNRESRPQTAKQLAVMLAAAMNDPNYVPPLPVLIPPGGTQRLAPPRGTVSHKKPVTGDSTEVMMDNPVRRPPVASTTPTTHPTSRRWLYVGLLLLLLVILGAAAILFLNNDEPEATVAAATQTVVPTATLDAAATATALFLLNPPTATIEPTATDAPTATPEPSPTLVLTETTTIITPTWIITATQAATLFTLPQSGADSMCVLLSTGDVITEVIGRSANSSWLHIVVNGFQGWVTARFFASNNAVADLPVSNFEGIVPGGCEAGTSIPEAELTPTVGAGDSGGTASYNTTGASGTSTGNGQWKVDFTVRVPTGGTYTFRVGELSTTAFFQSSDGSQDSYVVTVSGIGCNAPLVADLIVTRNGQQLTVVNEQNGQSGPLFITQPSVC